MYWLFSKEEKWSLIVLEVKYFQCLQKTKESDNSDQSFLSGCYERAVKSETSVEILSKDAQSIRRIQ